MSVLSIASAKSSPGVSTLSELVVQLRPPGQRCALVDCDPAGGEWLLRPGVTPERGLVTLAMAGRRDLARGALWEHVQVVGDGLEVVVGPAAARQAAGALDIVAERLAAHVRDIDAADVVVDCGRLSPSSPAMPLVRAADQVLLVSRCTVTEIVHLASWVEQLISDGCRLGLVLVEGIPRRRREVSYRPDEVAEALEVDVVGVVPDDPGAAAHLYVHPGSTAGLARSRLVRALAPLAARVLPPPLPATPDSPVEPVPSQEVVRR